MNEQGNTQSDEKKSITSTGLDENLTGLLCYLGIFVTGLIFTLLEKKSAFVKFHAMQSLVTFLSLWIAYAVLDFLPLIGWMLRTLISLLSLALWVVLMVKAYQKEWYRLPVFGDLADTLIKKFAGNSAADA